MPDETTSIDYVMEASSGPHFSGLRRLDRLPSSSTTSSPSHHQQNRLSSSSSSPFDSSTSTNQPFVIGFSHFRNAISYFILFSFFSPNFAYDLRGFYYVVGVSGGTASGKTTVCDMIIQQLHDHRVVLVSQVGHSITSISLPEFVN